VSLVTLIQGEGMLNDAKAPTILGFAITAATGGDFSAPGALGAFLLSLRILERELDHEEGLLPARTPV
jgi:NhaP-type Na+/H+ or K+/H+ antiporter